MLPPMQNPHVSKREIELFAESLTESERRSRIDGEFSHLMGRILEEFDRETIASMEEYSWLEQDLESTTSTREKPAEDGKDFIDALRYLLDTEPYYNEYKPRGGGDPPPGGIRGSML